MSLRSLDGVASASDLTGSPRRIGHDHFWERAVSRRRFFGSAAAAAGMVAMAGALRPIAAWAGGADPKPIPGGLVVGDQGYHVFLPGATNEPSTITDFDGVVGILQVQGSGTGRQGGAVVPLNFDNDMRFMQGRYIGQDGRLHHGTFGFI